MPTTPSIDYASVIRQHPWLVQRDLDCILSPDSDGLLCGLFMSHILNWKIRGYYDGKVLLLEKGYTARDCVFLDMEIFRQGVRSVGQHMVLYNKKQLPPNWNNFDNCLSANNVRGFDFKNDFQEKYPLATIHLLLGVVGSHQHISIPKESICPLLYTDGTFKNLFNYPDNCLSWLSFLHADDSTSSIHPVFFNDHYSISQLMVALKELFAEFRLIGGGKRGGDKIKFSNKKGELINFDTTTGNIDTPTVTQAEEFLTFLSQKTGWKYIPSSWTWNNITSYIFEKGRVTPGKKTYNDLMEKNPLSLAMTSSLDIEYTLDPQNIFH